MILLPALWRRFVCSFIPWFFILESFGGHCTRLYVLTLDIVLEGMNISYAKAKGVCLVGVLGSFWALLTLSYQVGDVAVRSYLSMRYFLRFF